jgi:hypothetical protein
LESHRGIDVGSSRRRTEGRQDLWIIIAAAAIFSLIAMWSMPGFPAIGPGDQARDSYVPPPTGSTAEGQVVPFPGGTRLAP